MKAQRGNRRITFSFNLGARWQWVVNATPQQLYPQERRVTCCTGVWVGPSPRLNGCGFDPRTVQHVESRYMDYDIPAQLQNKIIFNL